MRQHITFALLCVSLSGCSLWQQADVQPEAAVNNTTTLNKNIPVSQRAEASNRTGSLRDLFAAPDEKDAQLERNPDLWAAALDVLSGFALRSTDQKGGVIVTDWVQQGATQFQITVRVEGNRILPRYVPVTILKRNAQGIAAPADPAVAQALQNRIIERAKALRNKREGG